MEQPCAKIGCDHIFHGEAAIVEHGLIRVDPSTVRPLDDNGVGYRIGNSADFAFVLPQQLLFYPLEVLNISIRSVPSDDVAELVTQRFNTEQEPAIFSVAPPQAAFDLTRLPRGPEGPKRVHHLLPIFLMNGESPSPAAGFLRGWTPTVIPSLV